jgi:tRNA pseudouridine55 synthase
VDGILIVDKPAGPTSHDVVARVRRAVGIRSIGHTGTLDPMATGVLPLVLGRATRLARFLAATEKTYVAAIRLGRSTDTYDATGRGVSSGGCGGEGRTCSPDHPQSVGRPAIEDALAGFLGTYDQRPPPFSAKKIDGVRAYVRARQGASVELKAAPVTVHELAIVACAADLVTLRIVCSAGFYVRALAQALGERLGTGAHLESLRRTKAGGFDERQAVRLETIELEGAAALGRAVPAEQALPHLPVVVLTTTGEERARHGALLGPSDFSGPVVPNERGSVRLVGPAGSLIAIGRPGPMPGSLHPFVVMG